MTDWHQPLFNLMHNKGHILLCSELDEIIDVVKSMLDNSTSTPNSMVIVLKVNDKYWAVPKTGAASGLTHELAKARMFHLCEQESLEYNENHIREWGFTPKRVYLKDLTV